MTFVDWVNKEGRTALAEKLGITRQAVNAWCSGASAPKLSLAPKLIRLSKGKVTLDSIVTTTQRRKRQYRKTHKK
jgi:DNA-binding XRE family transcriptional regulator